MSKKAKDTVDTGGPAFSRAAFDPGADAIGDAMWDRGEKGMTLLDWFAGQFLGAIIAKEGCSSDGITTTMIGPDPIRDAQMWAYQDAERAYIYARAMIVMKRRMEGGAE